MKLDKDMKMGNKKRKARTEKDWRNTLGKRIQKVRAGKADSSTGDGMGMGLWSVERRHWQESDRGRKRGRKKR